MDYPSRWLGIWSAAFVALVESHSAFAQMVVLDSFDGPAGGQSLTTVATGASPGGFNSSRVSSSGVPGGSRDLFVVTSDPPPISSGSVRINDGAPGLNLGISPGTSGWCGVSYGFTGESILDLSHFSAFRLENVTSDRRIFVSLGVIDQSGYRADLSFGIDQPILNGPVDFAVVLLVPQSHPVDLTRISHLSFGIAEDAGGQTHVGSLGLLPGTAVPEPAGLAGWVAASLGLWAVSRRLVPTRGPSHEGRRMA